MPMAVYVQKGCAIDYTPGADVAAGDVVVQGDLVGVSPTPIASGEAGSLAVEGVFDFAKQGGAAVTFSIGDLAYWDDTNDVAVATDGAGAGCVGNDEETAALAAYLSAVEQAQALNRETVRQRATEIFDTTHVVDRIIEELANLRTSITSGAVAGGKSKQGNGVL